MLYSICVDHALRHVTTCITKCLPLLDLYKLILVAHKFYLERNNSCTFVCFFAQEGSFVCCAYLQLKGIPLASLDPSQEGYGWVSMDEEDEKKEEVAVLCLHLEGAALVSY